MARINKFPLVVINTKATESNFGLMDTLQNSVGSVTSAVTTKTVSEKGIRDSINDIDFVVSGQNSGSGETVFESTSALNPDTIYFNSLSGQGCVFITSDDNNVYLNTTQPGLPGDGVSGTTVMRKSINGGVEQECIKISSTVFAAVSSIVGFQNLNTGDAIGKIIILCDEVFDSTGAQYSIGNDSDPECYVKKFTPPTVTGLVNFEYGVSLSDKVEYITHLTSSAVASYEYLMAGGKLTNSPSIADPNSITDKVIKIDVANSTASVLTSVLPEITFGQYALQTSTYLYSIGGYGYATRGNTDNTNKINFTTYNVTTCPNSFSIPTYDSSYIGASETVSTSYGYCFGGSHEDSGADAHDAIMKFTFSTESYSYNPNSQVLIFNRFGCRSFKDDNYVYIGFGGPWGTTPYVDLFNISTETITYNVTMSNNLIYCGTDGQRKFYGTGYNSGYGYWFLGSNFGTDDELTTSIKINLSASTAAELASVSPVKREGATSKYDSLRTFLFGGQYNATFYSSISKFLFATDTISDEAYSLPISLGHSINHAGVAQ